MHNNWQKRSQSAQGMVEFALVLPILLMLILGIFAFGHFMFVYVTTVSASREAARYGSAAGPSENGIARYQDCNAIRASARRVGSIAGVSNVLISFDEGPGKDSIGSCENALGELVDKGPDDVGLGDRIVVDVTTNYKPIVPLVNIPSFDIHSKSVRTILRNAPVGTAEVALQAQSTSKQNTGLTITKITIKDQTDPIDYSKVGVQLDVYFTMTHTGSLAAPTGDVKIKGFDEHNNSPVTAECTATLAAGHCTTNFITPGVPGPWKIKAVYPGDALYNGSVANEAHQVYYFTSVDITSHLPDPSIVDSGKNVEVYYIFTPDPVVSGGYAPIKELTISDGATICTAKTDTTGPCVIPAYTDPADRVITISFPADDPYFLPSSKSVNHVVNSGYATTTTIDNIVYVPPAVPSTGSYYEIGNEVKIQFVVKAAEPEKVPTGKVPTGKVVVTAQNSLTCEAAIDSNGLGECKFTLNSRGTNGNLLFSAHFVPSDPIFDESNDTRDLPVNKLKPVLTVLGHTPDPSGVNNAVTVTFQAAPPLSTPLVVSGKVTVSLGGSTCTGTLGADGMPAGQGKCSLVPTAVGTWPINLSYDGLTDYNFEGPASQPTVPNHVVTICPTVVYRTFHNTPGKQASQMVVTVNNPLETPVSILQVNASWPTTVQKMYIKQLYLFTLDSDASSWSCNSNNGCLWDAPGGTGVVSSQDAANGRDYFSSAFKNDSCSQYGTEPVGTCYEWKNSSTADLAAHESKDLYIILSVNAQKTGWFNTRLRTNNQSCPWIQAEFLNNTAQ